MARKLYWIWSDGYLHRIIYQGEIFHKKDVCYALFKFQKNPGKRLYCIDLTALYKTKKEFYDQGIKKMIHYYERE